MGVSWHLNSRASRVSALAMSLGIALAAVGGVVPARAATTTTDPAKAAAGWVATKVEAGGLGAGSLADAIFALAAAHVGGTAAADALNQLKSKVDAYAGYGGTLKPGALAKTMLAVIVAGGDPTAFNGHNLESDLRGLQITSGTDTGRFGTAVINDQALAILALAATSGGVPAGAGDWLAGKQCAAGDYQWDGSCPTPAGSEDPDTTAMALQALLAAGSSAAADKATTWLVNLQASNGSFAAFGTANANSTGLAAEAIRAAGHTAKADAAEAWLTGLQYGCSAAAANRGAIPYTKTDPGFGGPFSSTAQGVLAFGAPRLDKLSMAEATADAPLLACSASSGPTASAGLPTQPPTDAAAPSGSDGSSSGGMLLLAVVLAAMTGALVFDRRRWLSR